MLAGPCVQHCACNSPRTFCLRPWLHDCTQSVDLAAAVIVSVVGVIYYPLLLEMQILTQAMPSSVYSSYSFSRDGENVTYPIGLVDVVKCCVVRNEFASLSMVHARNNPCRIEERLRPKRTGTTVLQNGTSRVVGLSINVQEYSGPSQSVHDINWSENLLPCGISLSLACIPSVQIIIHLAYHESAGRNIVSDRPRW